MGLLQLLSLLAFVRVVTPTTFTPPPQFNIPPSEAVDNVNLLIGNGGFSPGGSGGMIPSTGPPFAMTRWIAQTQINYVSATPYNVSTFRIHGFQSTRQPAIWMGESASVAVVPGVGEQPTADFEKRGMDVKLDASGSRKEVITPGYYNVELDDGNGGTILAEQTSTSRVGHLRFTFSNASADPFILIEAARPSVTNHVPTNITFPSGSIQIPAIQSQPEPFLEICGSSKERQDSIITPVSDRAASSKFEGFFCARIQYADGTPITRQDVRVDVIKNGTTTSLSNKPGNAVQNFEGPLLSTVVHFPRSKSSGSTVVVMRIGTSFISADQARANIAAEIPDSKTPPTLEHTAAQVRGAWAERLDRIKVVGGTDVQKHVLFTGAVRSSTFPSEQDEGGRYFSAYDGKVHSIDNSKGIIGGSYTGYSIWDTFRAEWAWQILFAADRMPGMVSSMLNDFTEGGRLPMWKNIAETNIMVGTHVDSLIGEAARKGVKGFDMKVAWQAVWKDATVPPILDDQVSYMDRQENVDYEARAGLSTVYNVQGKGWVADDMHSESGSRTLDYAYDDFAASVLARVSGQPQETIDFLENRALTAPWTLWNNETGFMEARNADGSWAGPDNGWTEGDKWAYSFDVVQDIPELARRRGGNASFIQSLEDHFEGGHNHHENEPSHHIPYLYSLAGAAFRTSDRVRDIALTHYNDSAFGLSGNEDCGQMSAWYFFSAMGFYPVNPASGAYVVGSPFFEQLSIDLPNPPQDTSKTKRTLTITAPGASTGKPYIKSLTIDGVPIDTPLIMHEQIANGANVVFEMSEKVEAWGNQPDVLSQVFGIDI